MMSDVLGICRRCGYDNAPDLPRYRIPEECDACGHVLKDGGRTDYTPRDPDAAVQMLKRRGVL